jgi:2,3-bisphosphoglycerate-dependent phosphoglycerate mutase
MAFLVLLRHGQSLWNQKNLFTGWVDISLSPKGEDEARRAGDLLTNYRFDVLFSSALKRAQETAKIVLQGHSLETHISEALNERRYGELEGKDKDAVRQLYGAHQVEIWRRSFDKKPPGGESLKDTFERVVPYFQKEIEPRLKEKKTILICAHGNSLRALVKYLDNLCDEEIVTIEIPTGEPIVYEFDEEGKVVNKSVLKSHRDSG